MTNPDSTITILLALVALGLAVFGPRRGRLRRLLGVAVLIGGATALVLTGMLR
jgi:hypothetical protein